MTIKKNITNFAKPEIIFGEKSFQKLFELLENIG